jgi:hypothetical protein
MSMQRCVEVPATSNWTTTKGTENDPYPMAVHKQSKSWHETESMKSEWADDDPLLKERIPPNPTWFIQCHINACSAYEKTLDTWICVSDVHMLNIYIYTYIYIVFVLELSCLFLEAHMRPIGTWTRAHGQQAVRAGRAGRAGRAEKPAPASWGNCSATTAGGIPHLRTWAPLQAGLVEEKMFMCAHQCIM